ncbi:MAG: phenylalanine--tRNA ligase subunit beta [Oligoflexia bacterium]|nr:phenylalanine--tRNA ligase subunit beta [Oligoflexia bacterium]
MKISWNWLSEMVDLSALSGPDALAALLTRRGLEVEEILPQAQGFERVVTVKILERNKHPEADRLSLCKVSLGSGEPLEIVCGAQNMKAGDIVALAQIGARLPNGLKIEKSKIRGVVSNGMLCSETELGLKKESEGILILPETTPLGEPLAKILGLDDTILAFKLTANRGDCLSHFGMAREVAAALGVKAKRPDAAALPQATVSPISIHLDAGEAGPQFYGCLIDGVKVGPSPAWLVKKLEKMGSRSINNLVDATNLVMWELGQPVHAYDADLIEGKEIRVRTAKEGEELPLLDGTSIKLAGNELVIADAKRAVGLAGVMGGGNSEVRDSTRRVFLECAEFDPILVRRASSRHQKRTEASHRFERGVDPAGLTHAIARLSSLVLELAGGKVAGVASARLPSRAQLASREIRVAPDYFPRFLGMKCAPEQALKILTDLSCEVVKGAEDWNVRVPSWRKDLSLPQDLAEEIARTLGYDQIEETIPVLSSAPRSSWEDSSAGYVLMNQAKDALVAAGLSETINFSFTSRAELKAFDLASSAVLVNPLSEELEALVPSLLPGLVKNAIDQWSHHFGSESLAIRLFELRPTFSASGPIQAQGEMETGVKEAWKLSFVVSGPRYAQALQVEQAEVDFYDIKAIAESLFQALGARGVRLLPMSESRKGPHPLFHPGQSVEILAGNEVAGAFGLFHPGKARALKTRAPLWIGEIDWSLLAKQSRSPVKQAEFKPIPSFPPMERDFALVVRSDLPVDKITQVALKAGRPLAKAAKIFDIYRGSQVAEGMTSVAVRVIFYEESRSLQESEAEAASNQILAAWKKELGAELRG